jgi:hypothetical protein
MRSSVSMAKCTAVHEFIDSGSGPHFPSFPRELLLCLPGTASAYMTPSTPPARRSLTCRIQPPPHCLYPTSSAEWLLQPPNPA